VRARFASTMDQVAVAGRVSELPVSECTRGVGDQIRTWQIIAVQFIKRNNPHYTCKTNTCKGLGLVLHATGKDSRAYKPPKEKMTERTNFCRMGRWSLQTTCKGRTNTIRSVKTPESAIANEKTTGSMQVASKSKSHTAAMGSHWNEVTKTPEMHHAQMMRPMTMVAIWRKGVKRRRYSNKMETLASAIAKRYISSIVNWACLAS